jgi:uncharacterized membrane protein
MKTCFCGWAALGVIIAAAGQAKADYLFTTIDAPGSTGTVVNGINNAGQIVGSYGDAQGGGGGFLLSGGVFTTFNVPGSVSTEITGINDRGQMVGNYQTSLLAESRGFLLSGGNYTPLVVPGSTATYVQGINDSGQIVGYYSVRERGPYYGFLLSGGVYTTLTGPPGSAGALVGAINNAGQIVGTSSLGPFLLNGGIYTMLNVPGYPFGINDADQIVGSFENYTRGFLLSDGVLTTFGLPGTDTFNAFGINDAGQIVGEYALPDGTVHGYLATPIPEPASVLLFSIGMVGLIWWSWWRRTVNFKSVQATPRG